MLGTKIRAVLPMTDFQEGPAMQYPSQKKTYTWSVAHQTESEEELGRRQTVADLDPSTLMLSRQAKRDPTPGAQ
jgi:hypothetical protein